MAASIDEQVDAIFLGAEFGDETLAATMRKEFRDKLVDARARNQPLRVYAGYDPSKPDLHLGHSITMRKLRLFQDFGHDVTFVVGTFTAQVGDASDKLEGRPRLEAERVRAAAESYTEQAFAILDPERTTIRYNDEWLSTLHLPDVIEIASVFTVQQFLARETFRKRYDSGDPIRLHEFMYALLQGYDALHLDADVQLGATEQLFNIMAGRRLQDVHGKRGCTPITFPVLVGLDGKSRMSKSAGNYVGLRESPNDQFGKVMSIDDDTMRNWIPLVSSWSPPEVAARLRELDAKSLHPMELKKQLAADIVTLYHGEGAAKEAQGHFEALHQQRDYSAGNAARIVLDTDVLLDAVVKIASESKRGARRLLGEGAVRVNDEIVDDENHRLTTGDLVRVGKRHLYVVEVPA
ncbi:MAG TPA: tyrosine--tRNA ligase [Acidimicrobiia bacterium]|nr:tyrosine--tRNA ligase [Acidimicrobiia bacterium]